MTNDEALWAALEESVKLQTHYAELLNMHDGGERKGFDSAQAWLDRLFSVGRLPIHLQKDTNYQLRHAGAERALREIAEQIKPKLPPGFGFGLFLFEFGDHASMFWISNAQRPDMIKALREWIARQQ